MSTENKKTHVGHTNPFRIKDYKVITGQVNRHEPWSAYINLGVWGNLNGLHINKAMTSVERQFRILVFDLIKDIFPEATRHMVDVQWSDCDYKDLSNQYSYMFFEITLFTKKDNKFNIKQDKRFKLIAERLVEWLTSNNLVSFVAKNPKIKG